MTHAVFWRRETFELILDLGVKMPMSQRGLTRLCITTAKGRQSVGLEWEGGAGNGAKEIGRGQILQNLVGHGKTFF